MIIMSYFTPQETSNLNRQNGVTKLCLFSQVR